MSGSQIFWQSPNRLLYTWEEICDTFSDDLMIKWVYTYQIWGAFDTISRLFVEKNPFSKSIEKV